MMATLLPRKALRAIKLFLILAWGFLHTLIVLLLPENCFYRGTICSVSISGVIDPTVLWEPCPSSISKTTSVLKIRLKNTRVNNCKSQTGLTSTNAYLRPQFKVYLHLHYTLPVIGQVCSGGSNKMNGAKEHSTQLVAVE